MRRATIGLALLLLPAALVLAPRSAGALGVELEGRYWAPSFSGAGGIPQLGIDPGLGLDLDRLLGLSADDSLEARVTLRLLLGFYLRGSYQTMGASGSRSLSLGDLDLGLPIPLPPIAIEGSLRSSLDFDYARLGVGWRFVSPKDLFTVGAFAEAKGFRGTALLAVDSPLFAETVSESFEGGAGAWGVIGSVKPAKSWEVFGEASWAVGGDDVDLTDYELGARYFPTSIFGVGLGYRALDVSGVVDGVALDAGWDGAFVTAVVRF